MRGILVYRRAYGGSTCAKSGSDAEFDGDYQCIRRVFQIFSQTIWSAIYEPALLAFPKWTSKSLSLLPIWGSVMTAALVFPTCMLINKYGTHMDDRIK